MISFFILISAVVDLIEQFISEIFKMSDEMRYKSDIRGMRQTKDA